MVSPELTFEERPSLDQRLRLFRWIIPLSFALVSILYQLVVADRVSREFGHETHLVIEILFYGSVGPLAAFWVIQLIKKWLEEKEFAEIHARQIERHLASIIAASADAIISLDFAGLIESWNNGARLIYGYEADEMLGQPFQVLFGSGKSAAVEFDWLAEEINQRGFLRGYETMSWGGDGHPIAVDLTGTSLSNAQGEYCGISIIMRDITHRKQREEDIKQLNASLNMQVAERTQELADKVIELDQANQELQKLDQSRSEFISLVSHQVRAPLTNMQGAVERMQADCGVINNTCGRMFTVLEQQISRTDQLVRDVLNADRIESGEIGVNLEPISILPTIRRVVEQFHARTSNRHVIVHDKPGMPLVLADSRRISEVLVNLLDNADKYTHQGKDISIEVHADQTEVSVIVRDFGKGIPPGEIDLLFDKFYRTDSSDSQTVYGYGLGLYVCRSLIEVHGGRIWAENHKDGGAVFTFTLPVWVGK